MMTCHPRTAGTKTPGHAAIAAFLAAFAIGGCGQPRLFRSPDVSNDEGSTQVPEGPAECRDRDDELIHQLLEGEDEAQNARLEMGIDLYGDARSETLEFNFDSALQLARQAALLMPAEPDLRKLIEYLERVVLETPCGTVRSRHAQRELLEELRDQ